MKKLLLVPAACLGIVALSVLPASGHHPEISGTAVCSDQGTSLVTVTAVAWDNPEPIRRVNNSISIDSVINGVFANAAVGAFNAADNYTIVVTVPEPTSLGSVVFRATSVTDWGPNGEFGSAGEYRETTVQLPTNCPQASPITTVAPTTTIPTTTTSTTAPTTTAPSASSTTAPTTTIAPVTTGTATTIAPSTTVPTDAKLIERERLATTGKDERVKLFLAGVLLLVGLFFIALHEGKRVRRR